MFTADAAAVPHGLQARVPAQVVHMPVGSPGSPSMVVNACPQSSGAERAADVHVPAQLKLELAQATDADGAGAGGAEDQDVRAGNGGAHGFILQRGAATPSTSCFADEANRPPYLRRRTGCCTRCRLVALLLLAHHDGLLAAGRGDSDEAAPQPLQRVLPADLAGGGIEAEKLAFGGGVKIAILESDVDEVASQLRPPQFAPRASVEGDDGSCDADE